MKTLIITISLLSTYMMYKNINPAHQIAHQDSLFIKIPEHYDSANLKYSNPNILRIVMNKYNYKGFSAPGAFSLDINRDCDFKTEKTDLDTRFKLLFIDAADISDSLKESKRDFFKRHTFFAVITRGTKCYIYRAKGEYMYKNFEKDTKYDTSVENVNTVFMKSPQY